MRGRKRANALILAIACIFVLGLAGTAAAATMEMVLQIADNATYDSGVDTVGQQFTPTYSGQLDKVAVRVRSDSSIGNPRNVHVSVWSTTAGGLPLTRLATSQTQSVPTDASLAVWREFTFASPYVLTAGTKYALVITGVNGDIDYRYNTSGSTYLDHYLINGSFNGTSWSGWSTDSGDDLALQVYMTKSTYTLTYTAGANGSITGDSPQTVDHGDSGAEVTAVPDANYHFVKWSDDVMTESRTDTNVTADLDVEAVFAINTYTLTYTAGANGSITGDSPQTVDHGDSGAEVTAVPDANYHFVKWSDDVMTESRTDMGVTADLDVEAIFAIDTYTLTYSAGANGSITGDTPQTVDHGSDGTEVTAVADANYHFVKWSDDVMTESRTDANVTADLDVEAVFAIDTYTLTYSAGANGSITGDSPQTVDHGSDGTEVTAVPDVGYHFVKWSDDVMTESRTDMGVTADLDVEAIFAINTYTLTYTAGTGGSITGDSPQTVDHGSDGAEVTAVPDTGYHFVKWSDDVMDEDRTDVNVTGDLAVTAIFAPDTTTMMLEHDAAGVVFDRFTSGYSTAYSGGGYVYGRWGGTRLDAKFTGSKVTWVGPKQPNYGKADVYIDNVWVKTVDCYAADADKTLSATLFESGALTDAVHTISIRLSGAKNAASSGNVVVLDYFEVEGAAPEGAGVRTDERAGTFAGTWIKSTNSTYYAKGYAYSRWAGASWKATFSGTRVSWIGPKTTDYGRAKVYIDGVYLGTVSQYGAMGWRTKVWESPVLTPGTHTIEIKPTGTKDSASTGTNIVIDGIDVVPLPPT